MFSVESNKITLQISSVLHLNDVSVSDIGIYMCNAEFSDGKTSSGAFYLTQNSKFNAPSCHHTRQKFALSTELSGPPIY